MEEKRLTHNEIINIEGWLVLNGFELTEEYSLPSDSISYDCSRIYHMEFGNKEVEVEIYEGSKNVVVIREIVYFPNYTLDKMFTVVSGENTVISIIKEILGENDISFKINYN